jgi:nicotinate dehydrogenase subunit B
MKEEIHLTVNHNNYHFEVEPLTPLIYVLRNDLGLKGVKLACGKEQCGACKVLVDGQAVPSCKLPVKDVAGLEIITVEGLGTADNLHPLQQAFLEEQALQCGFCTPGMIITAQGLLNRTRYPTDEEIREALVDDLCRCGIYDRVRRAIKLRIARPDANPAIEVISNPEPGLSSSHFTPTLSPSLLNNPDLDSWVRINTDGSITLFTGKVEFGQGIKTALAQIGADELDVSLDRIRVAPTDSAYSPDEGLTVSSMSLETSGNAIRLAAAEARNVLLSIAYEELEVPLDRLRVDDGTISDPLTGRSTTYWQLFGGQLFSRQVTGRVQPKSSPHYTLVGQAVKNLDLMDKVTGSPCFVHDLTLPGMVHARVVRPPNYTARLVSVDLDPVESLPGVLKVVQDGSFLAVIAEREEQAVAAADALHTSAQWSGTPDFPPQEKLFEHLLSQSAQSYLVLEGTPQEGPIPPIEIPPTATDTITATYYRPYHMHASLGPSAAVAQNENGELTIWAHSQGVYPLRSNIAQALRMPLDQVRVIHMQGPGCYGHNGADDAALDAALLASALPGLPISLKWSRQDEHTWEPYGPAMVISMQASLDADGQVIAWNHDVWSYPHLGRPRPGNETSGLVAAWHLEQPFLPHQPVPILAPEVGSHRNATPIYDFPNRRIVKHFVTGSPLRVSSMRGLGAYANIFAIESFMDELAFTARIDPLEFRLRHLQDERARAVIIAAADKAGWHPGERLSGVGRGRGIAFAQYKNRQCYAAVVVELSLDLNTGQIHLERAVIAADAGQVVNPDGLSNQLEGGFLQAASWTLKEQVTFNEHGITSCDWDTYALIRFPEAPRIETILINHPNLPFLGSGEATQGPAPATIANAIFNAAGIRLREIPFTPEKVKAALSAVKPT